MLRTEILDEASLAITTSQHFGRVGIESGPVRGPLFAIEVCQALVRRKPGLRAVDGFHLVKKITRQAAILVEEVAPVPPVVPADPEVGPDPQYLVHVANRGGDFMNEPLVLEEDYLGFPVWVIVILPALGFHVVFQH